MFSTIETKSCTVVTYVHWSLSFYHLFCFRFFLSQHLCRLQRPTSVPLVRSSLSASGLFVPPSLSHVVSSSRLPYPIWSIRSTFPTPSGFFIPPSLPHLHPTFPNPSGLFVPLSLPNLVSSSHLPYPTWSLRPNFPTLPGLI